MSTFQTTFDWSQNVLNRPPTVTGPGQLLWVFFIAVLFVLALWWWWIFYGSSINNRSNSDRLVFNDLKSSLKNPSTKLLVKSNGMMAAE